MKTFGTFLALLIGVWMVLAVPAFARNATVERMDDPGTNATQVFGGMSLWNELAAAAPASSDPIVNLDEVRESEALKIERLRQRQDELERGLFEAWLVEKPNMRLVHARIAELGRIRAEIAHKEADRMAAMRVSLEERAGRAYACGIYPELSTNVRLEPFVTDPLCLLIGD